MENPHPEELRLKMLKSTEKFSSIASAITLPKGGALGV